MARFITCETCGGDNWENRKTTNTQTGIIVRLRRCTGCGARLTSYERPHGKQRPPKSHTRPQVRVVSEKVSE